MLTSQEAISGSTQRQGGDRARLSGNFWKLLVGSVSACVVFCFTSSQRWVGYTISTARMGSGEGGGGEGGVTVPGSFFQGSLYLADGDFYCPDSGSRREEVNVRTKVPPLPQPCFLFASSWQPVRPVAGQASCPERVNP